MSKAGKGNAKGVAERRNGVQGRGSGAEFKKGDVGPIQAGLKRQHFLSEVTPLAQCAKCVAESCVVVFHHGLVIKAVNLRLSDYNRLPLIVGVWCIILLNTLLHDSVRYRIIASYLIANLMGGFMIVLIGGEKGGTGKSTICTNLATWLVLEGADVMLLDADPQTTSAKWVERRNEAGLPQVHCTEKTGDVYKSALDLGKRYDVVLIDAGGRDSRELRTSMVSADIMLVPIRASQADLETLPHVNDLVGLARGMNPELKAFGLLSMAPSNPVITEVRDAQEFLADFPEMVLSPCIVRDRKVFRDALLEGRGVIEMDNGKAKAEVQLLAQDLFD